MAWSKLATGIYYNGETKKDRTKFRARIVAKSDDGKRRDHYGPHRVDRAEAEADLARLKKDYQSGGSARLDNNRVTFGQLAEEYSEYHLNPPTYVWSDDKRIQRKTSGVASWQDGRYAMKLFTEYFGNRQINTIKDQDIHRWKEERRKVPKERGGGPRTEGNLNRTLDWLRQAFNYASKQGYLVKKLDVAKHMHLDMEHQRERKLSEDEETRLLALANEKLKPLLIFLLDTGLRPSEAQRLRREHIDLSVGKYGHLNLSADITRKSRKRRDLPIFTARCRQVLIERLNNIADGPSAVVFGRWNIRNGLEFASACEAANISDFRLHDCRRTWASKAVNALPISHCMRYGGWSKPETLMRYVRTDECMDDHNVENFEAYIFKSGTTTVHSEQVN